MKRLALLLIPALALAVALAVLNGCGGGGGNANEALLGANLELSGSEGSWGQDSQKGIELARDEINAKPDQKIKLKFLFEDDKSDPGTSKDVMKKLVTQDGVIAVIGAVGSGRTIPAAKVAAEQKVPLMTHAATNVDIVKISDYVSRICFNDDVQGAAMAIFARETLKKDSAVMIVEKGNPYSEGLCASFRRVFTQKGGKIIDELAYQKDAQDFKALITTLKDLNPPIVWVPGYFPQMGPLIKQARDAGFQAPFLGADGWDDPQLFALGGPAIKGNYFSNHFNPYDTDPKVVDFVNRFKAKFPKDGKPGDAPGAMAALAYDATYAMADAVNRAKTLTPEGMKDAINSIKDLKGVCGTITMAPNREVVKDVLILETGANNYISKQTIKAEDAK